jgi:ABC-type antimicrobial peptide transport system permease subunit
MMESSFEQVFNRNGVTDFAIQLKNYDQRYQTLDQLTAVMQADHHPIEGTDVGRDTSVSDTANGIFAIMDLLSVVAIVISVILLLGTISSLITEQIKIIGTLKAIGGQRGQIMRHYLALVFCYSVIGTVIGLAVGVAGGYLLANYLGSLVSLDIGPLQIIPWQILESIAVGIGTPLLATLIPVWIGTKITARQALQGYGLENTAATRGGWAKASRALFGFFPQTIQAGVRGVFRKRLRTVLTMVSLALAGASLLSVLTASYSFNTFLNHVYDVYHFDAMVSLSDPLPFDKFQQVLGSVQGVQSMESIFQDTPTTQWGNAALTGVQINTRMYQKDLVAGRWFTASDQNSVIISQDAANKSGLKVGDSISFTLSTYKATWHIIGIVQDFSGIGPGNLGVLVAPIGQINTLLQQPADVTQSVMIRSTYASPTQAQVDTLTQSLNNALIKAGLIAQVTTPQQLIAQDQSKYGIIYIMLDAVAIIIALVGAIGLSNALSMSVLERRREIGILRSMGAVRSKIVQVFWAEGTTLGFLSWVVAVIIGIPAAYGLVQVQAHVLAPVPFAFNSIDLVWTLATIIVLSALASAGPVLAAVRVKIVQTLSYE